MENLCNLDTSFNRIIELQRIGKMKTLGRFILTCAELVNLRELDCRRNLISDLCRLQTSPSGLTIMSFCRFTTL
jgi:hypothetical protein